MIVVDPNVIAYLLIEGERTEEARRAWLRDRDWLVPPLWRSDYLNVLWVSVRAAVLEPPTHSWLGSVRRACSPVGSAAGRHVTCLHPQSFGARCRSRW